MKRLRLPETTIKLGETFRPQLRVVDYVATKRGDAERGPKAWMSPADTKIRALTDGQLIWIEGPRRKEIAPLTVDKAIPDGSIRLRDIAGVAVSEHVTVTPAKVDEPVRPRKAR